MASFSMTKHVDAPRDAVFDMATDFHNTADFIEGIQSCEVLTDGPVAIGTRFRETRVMFGKEAIEEMEVTEFDSPSSFTLEAESCGCHYRVQHTFNPDIAGTTIQLEFNTRPVTLMAKVMSPLGRLMMGPMRKAIEADLNDLAAAAEARAPQPELA